VIVAVLTAIAMLTAETRLRREPPINAGLFAHTRYKQNKLPDANIVSVRRSAHMCDIFYC